SSFDCYFSLKNGIPQRMIKVTSFGKCALFLVMKGKPKIRIENGCLAAQNNHNRKIFTIIHRKCLVLHRNSILRRQVKLFYLYLATTNKICRFVLKRLVVLCNALRYLTRIEYTLALMHEKKVGAHTRNLRNVMRDKNHSCFGEQ